MLGNYIYCCDWGTTTLRTRLVDTQNNQIIHQGTFRNGVSYVFEEWRNNHASSDADCRQRFYLLNLKSRLDKLVADVDVAGIPVVISGMASSNVGIKELQYADLPFSLSGCDAIIDRIDASADFNHPVFILSGVRDGGEVMRGEETQLSGLKDIIESLTEADNVTVVLPGTHSKHVNICDGRITKIATYVTGELFDVLTQHGLLKHAVQCPVEPIDQDDWTVFREGVVHSGMSPLLQSLFRVRTNHLLSKLSKNKNYHFLSGLLIGYELRNLPNAKKPKSQILLCSEQNLFEHYRKALEVLALDGITHFVSPEEVVKATVKGQVTIMKHYLNQ